VREGIVEPLSRRPEKWQDLRAAVRAEWWLNKHVNEVVHVLKADGVIVADPVPGRKFGAAANPEVGWLEPMTQTAVRRSGSISLALARAVGDRRPALSVVDRGPSGLMRNC